MSQGNTIEFRLYVDFSPILTPSIQMREKSLLTLSLGEKLLLLLSAASLVCLVCLLLFQRPIRLVASLVAVYACRQEKEERAISSPELPLLSKHKCGADLLDTYISW